MEQILKNNNYKNKNIDILIPTVRVKNSGKVTINKKTFDSMIKYLLGKYGKYTKTAEVIYSYNNLKYKIINNHTRKVQSYKHITAISNEKFIVSVYEEKTINDNQFPVIQKYNDICKRNNMIYKVDGISIVLVTESYSGESSKYYPYISFYNNNIDSEKVDEIVDTLYKFIFN